MNLNCQYPSSKFSFIDFKVKQNRLVSINTLHWGQSRCLKEFILKIGSAELPPHQVAEGTAGHEGPAIPTLEGDINERVAIHGVIIAVELKGRMWDVEDGVLPHLRPRVVPQSSRDGWARHHPWAQLLERGPDLLCRQAAPANTKFSPF